MVRKTGRLALLGLALGLGGAGCSSSEYYGRPLFQRQGWGPTAPPPMMTPPMFGYNPPPMTSPPPLAVATPPAAPMPAMPAPTEKFKVTHPEYVLEVPDVVNIDVLRAMPKAPYHVQPTDTLMIRATPALADESINGSFTIGPDGRISLGLNYGSVIVADLTVDQAEQAVRQHLAMHVQKPKVSVALTQTGAAQQVQGKHTINPDGTVRLGKFGGVFVAGMTVDEAKNAIEKHLAAHLVRPEVSVNVQGFRSKFYYVIAQGLHGEHVFRLPATGNETVLDAMSQVSGLAAAQPRVWIVRPAAPSSGMPEQILAVDWNGITRAGNTRTNYQLLPGDRLYVVSQPMAWSTPLSESMPPVDGPKLPKLLPANFATKQ